MASHQHRKTRSGRENEKPRSDDISWRDLAMIVYSWTDSRERDVDRTWWNAAMVSSPLLLEVALFPPPEGTVASASV